MDGETLREYRQALKSRDEWGTSELSDFFGVSGETIRRRINDGTITASQKETSLGTKWTVSSEEIIRNLSQSSALQNYLEKKNDDDLNSPGQTEVAYLRKKIERKDEQISDLQEKLGELRERNGKLETENEHLRARLNEIEGERIKKLSEGDGGIVNFAFGTARGSIDVVEGLAKKIFPG